jgi:hypothetical protein
VEREDFEFDSIERYRIVLINRMKLRRRDRTRASELREAPEKVRLIMYIAVMTSEEPQSGDDRTSTESSTYEFVSQSSSVE